ncbi:hypothetical protein BUE93_08490 [Chromobacterium amazonense]|uniref:Oxygen-regulated invasion protein OrgB n=2 Tax=Chromobacterium amazonense TaxID=1382803 RepID=A0A2S9X5Z6_9NEIS|nr:hypothetical protein BUE93_08490 [Chromobacterium amazonense]
MPRDIPLPPPQTLIDGVLLRQAKLRDAARNQSLELQARGHAKILLRNAERQAENLRQQGYQQGYQQGMIEALQQIAAYLAASQALALHWREQLAEHIRAMLTAAVDHPDTLLLLLNEWLSGQERSDATLHLTLPKSARIHQAQLMALLGEHWPGPVQLGLHDDTRWIMRCANQIAEFTPELYVESAGRHLQPCLDKLPQEWRNISLQALHKLIAQLEHQVNDSADRNHS